SEDSPVRKARQAASGLGQNITPGVDLYDLFELWGSFPVYPVTEDGSLDMEHPEYSEMILTYSMDDGRLHKKIFNPFFGRARHIVRIRSEEHTSELQSRENLVCRLLLAKKQTRV